jgi:carbamate kinase
MMCDMRIVAALGGNALLRRGERPDASVQVDHVRSALRSLAPLLAEHEVVLTHGNGPQVGVLAVESANDTSLSHPYPFDSLVAETQGLIGNWILQALTENDVAAAALVSRVLVSADDPAFSAPSKFVGQMYDEATAHRLAETLGWSIRADGSGWRRVVPSPDPTAIVELDAIRALIAAGQTVICAGGGGVPVVHSTSGGLQGVEAVIDKDLTSALLAGDLDADLLLLLTDVPHLYADFGTPDQREVREATPTTLRALTFPAGSMGPKVEASCRFVEGDSARRAVIGHIDDAVALVAGTAGTQIHH